MKSFYIYKIENVISNKVYIGSSSNPTKRKYDHFSLLNKNIHHSSKLQKAWNKYGENNFKFSIIYKNIGSYEEQLTCEQLYIDQYNACRDHYNMNCDATKVSCWTDEKLKSMGEKVSQKHKGKTPKNLENIRVLIRRPIIEYENNIFIREYQSAKEAGEFLGISYKNINDVLRGRSKSIRAFPNKIWKYKDGLPKREIKLNPNRKKSAKHLKVQQFDKDNNLINIFNSSEEASLKLGVCKATVHNLCSGKTKKSNLFDYKLKYLRNGH